MKPNIDEELWQFFQESASRRGVDAHLSPDKESIICTDKRTGRVFVRSSKLVQKD